MYRFGKISNDRLATCHKDMQLIMLEAIKDSEVDFGIASGHRTVDEQKELYASGRTKPGKIITQKDGVRNKSKHQEKPSPAADIYAWVNRKASWNINHVLYLAGVITGTAKRLKREGKIRSSLRWGGNWDQDGEVVTDQRFQDLVHFELVL